MTNNTHEPLALIKLLSEAAHAKTCPKKEGEHDEKCFEDVMARVEGIEEGLDEGVFARFGE